MPFAGGNGTSGSARRDEGLIRAIGPWALGATIINSVVGGGIFTLPATMSAAAGQYAPLAFLLCAIAMGAVVLCLAEATARIASSGGVYAVAQSAFGPTIGFLTAVMLWVGSALTCAGIAAAMADGFTAYITLPREIIRPLLIILVVAGLVALNLRGAAPAARVIGILTVVKLIPMLILVLVGGAWLLMGGAAAPRPPAAPVNFGDAVILALFAFSGMEMPLGASGEVKHPARTIPIALFIAMAASTLLYVAIQIVCDSLLGDTLASSSAPLSQAIAPISPALGILLLLGAAVSRMVWIGSNMLGSPRVLYAVARDGMMPRIFATVHARTGVPWVAVMTQGVAVAAIACTDSFHALAIRAGLVTAPVYVIACLAAWQLRTRGVALNGPVPRLPLLPAVVVVGAASMIAIIALAPPREIGRLVILIVAGAIWYGAVQWLRQRNQPERQARSPAR